MAHEADHHANAARLYKGDYSTNDPSLSVAGKNI